MNCLNMPRISQITNFFPFHLLAYNLVFFSSHTNTYTVHDACNNELMKEMREKEDKNAVRNKKNIKLKERKRIFADHKRRQIWEDFATAIAVASVACWWTFMFFSLCLKCCVIFFCSYCDGYFFVNSWAMMWKILNRPKTVRCMRLWT